MISACEATSNWKEGCKGDSILFLVHTFVLLKCNYYSSSTCCRCVCMVTNYLVTTCVWFCICRWDPNGKRIFTHCFLMIHSPFKNAIINSLDNGFIIYAMSGLKIVVMWIDCLWDVKKIKKPADNHLPGGPTDVETRWPAGLFSALRHQAFPVPSQWLFAFCLFFLSTVSVFSLNIREHYKNPRNKEGVFHGSCFTFTHKTNPN